MEYKKEDKDKKQEDDQAEKSVSLQAGAARPAQKTTNGSKKETIRGKKIMKKETNGHKNGQQPNNQNHIINNSVEEDSSAVMGGFRSKKQKIMCSISELTTPYSLDKLILKPPYITITKGNRIVGDYGHSTAIFKRPVIQGQVYMEFLIRQDAKKDKKATNNSAVRVGLCSPTFNTSYPLGFRESISYKSADGSVVSKGERIDSACKYGVGDVIGICLNMSPPNKIPNPEQISEGSSVTFYKNGLAVKTYKSLKQIFYCFGVSLYNYSQVQVVGGPQSVYKMPGEAKHYFSILGQKIMYKDLQSKRMFKL